MSETIYDADFAKYLPQALQKDPKMRALAHATADKLLEASGLIDNVLIYSRIDELPEELVDILAYDMHVDWYDYTYPLEAKRDLVKNSVKVHKKMGTKYAIETALGSLFPESEVEEWFQYEGEPGHFHIVLDVTEQKITADYAAIIQAVKMYKRLSAHMDELTYQGSVHGVIYTHSEWFKYKTPLTGKVKAGIYPERNVKGGQSQETIIIGTDAAGFIFTAAPAGIKPYRNKVFSNQILHIDAETALNAFKYTNIQAGQIKAGEKPHRSYRGQSDMAAVVLEDTLQKYHFTAVAAGTVPGRNTVQQTQGGTVENSVRAAGYSYSVKACGSRRRL